MNIHGIDNVDNENIKQIPDKLLVLYLREENPEVVVELLHSDLENIEKILRKVSNDIRQDEFLARKGKYCEWCDYRDLLCPEFG